MREQVSIVIVNFNQARLTLDCIDSIVKHTPDRAYEIIVVDNGSSASEIDILNRACDRFQLIRLDRNMFFGEASNLGAERATGELVLFLNNDIKVTPGWLEPLVDVLQTEYCAGAVGGRILDPKNELLEAGGIVRPDGWTVQVGKGGMKLPLGFIEGTRITDYTSGACLLMRTKVFLGLGGFDAIFEPAYFEDVDLAIRLRSMRLFTYYCGSSVVYHQESVTSNRVWSAEERLGHIKANHDRLMKRWGDYLARRLEEDIEPEPLPQIKWEAEAAPPPSTYRLVLYSARPLKVDAASRSLLFAAAALQRCCSVIIAADDTYSRCRIYSLSREFGIELASFALRRYSDLDPDAAELVVTFGAMPEKQLSMPHLAFDIHSAELLRFIENMT